MKTPHFLLFKAILHLANLILIKFNFLTDLHFPTSPSIQVLPGWLVPTPGDKSLGS